MITNGTTHVAPAFVAEFDRTLVNTAGGSVRHLVVTIRAPRQAPSANKPRTPLNLGLVIDASGSMAGKPLAATKAAALDVVAALPETDHLTLVSFADDVQLHAEALQLDAEGRATIETILRSLDTRGSTNLADGWLGGCTSVAQRQAACDVIERNQVVLLSDGHANAGETRPQMLARHASELRKRGIVTSTVGVGHNYSPTQLQAIAEAGGGRMHDAEEPSDIAQIVMAELNDTLATVVDNLELSLTLPSGTQPEPYGTAPFTPAATGYDVLMGAMLSGATRRVVIKLKLPAGEAASTLAFGLSARWTVPGDNKRYACNVAVPALRFDSGNACLAQPREIELAKKVVEQWVAHVYYRAMVLNQDGDGQAAMNFVEKETKYLHRYCAGVPELEEAIGGLDGFSSSVLHRYTAHTSKEMMLRAYKMGRGETSRRSRETHDFATLSAMEDAARKPPRSGRQDRDVK